MDGYELGPARPWAVYKGDDDICFVRFFISHLFKYLSFLVFPSFIYYIEIYLYMNLYESTQFCFWLLTCMHIYIRTFSTRTLNRTCIYFHIKYQHTHNTHRNNTIYFKLFFVAVCLFFFFVGSILHSSLIFLYFSSFSFNVHLQFMYLSVYGHIHNHTYAKILQ